MSRIQVYLDGKDITSRMNVLKRKGCVQYKTALIKGRDVFGGQVLESHQLIGYEITNHGLETLWPRD